MAAGDERGGDCEKIILPAAVYHVLPHQHAQPVAVIVPAHRFDLYVLSQYIEAHVAHELNVVHHRLVARRGVQPVRPVALIEHAGVKIRLAVEHKARTPVAVMSRGDGAHGKVALHPVLAQLRREVIQLRLLRRPEHGGGDRHGYFGVRPALVPHSAEHDGARRVRGRLHLNAHARRRDVRRYPQRRYIRLRHILHPYRLPYAALGGVPYAAALCALLAARILVRVRRVLYAHGQNILTARDIISYVNLKSRVSAAM